MSNEILTQLSVKVSRLRFNNEVSKNNAILKMCPFT